MGEQKTFPFLIAGDAMSVLRDEPEKPKLIKPRVPPKEICDCRPGDFVEVSISGEKVTVRVSWHYPDGAASVRETFEDGTEGERMTLDADWPVVPVMLVLK